MIKLSRSCDCNQMGKKCLKKILHTKLCTPTNRIYTTFVERKAVTKWLLGRQHKQHGLIYKESDVHKIRKHTSRKTNKKASRTQWKNCQFTGEIKWPPYKHVRVISSCSIQCPCSVAKTKSSKVTFVTMH